MKGLLLLCVFYTSCHGNRIGETLSSKYIKERQEMIEEELKASIGGTLILSQEEIAANDILMKYKDAELEIMFKDSNKFYFKKHFPANLELANNSKVYHIIKSMPKGAAIQLGRVNNMMLDIDFIITLTYEDYLYACFYNDTVKFHFSVDIPQVHCDKDNWVKVAKLRSSVKDAQAFDQHLKKFFTINVNKTRSDDIDLTNDKLFNLTTPLQSLLSYRPVAEKHFYHMLEYFYLDNVRYLELRVQMQPIYELDGLTHNTSFVANMYRQLINKFTIEHPDFFGVKFIIAISRDTSVKDIRYNIELVFKLKKEFPELFAGIDVDGHENKGKALIEISRYLVELKDDLNFFFHAGETNWYGTSVDENLADAIALNAKRIANAYALVKHPLLMTLVKEKDIGMEVSVISNAIHGLVKDLRNHPAATYLAFGLPVVLSSDNPGLWGVDPLSHDFYVTFMAIASRHADLKLLKQLVLNSIQYSSIDNLLKVKLLQSFFRSWSGFVKNVVKIYSYLGD